MKKQFYGRQHKATIIDYEYMSALSDEECCYSLSEREVQLLLAIIEPIGWATRYQQERSEIDQSVIDKWQGNLARKLMSGCCPDDGDLHRFTEDGTYETSTDGGDTWTPDPEGDPRNDYIAAPPLPGSGDDVKCAAADNARDQFKAIRDRIIELLTDASGVLVIIAAIIGALGFLAGISVAGIGISVFLFAMAGGILSMTPEDVADLLTDEVMDDFRCILFCHMGDNGQFTYDQWLAVIADIDATWANPINAFFHGLVAAMGYIGLSNATTIGAATADDCDCGCGECAALASFVVGLGTEVTRDDNSVTIDSQNIAGVFGNHRMTLNTGDPAVCCLSIAVEYITEPPFGLVKWYGCGETVPPNPEDGYHHGTPASGTSVWALAIDGTAPFRAKFTLG